MRVVNVKYIKGFQLQIHFSNGRVKEIDFEDFLKSAINPMTKKYLNVELFKKVKIESGFLTWGKNEMDLSGESLYHWKKTLH